MSPRTSGKAMTLGLAMTLLLAAPALSAVDITVRGLYFRPTEGAFRDIYGAGWKPGAEIAFRLSRRLDIWMSGGHFARSGKLTFTAEDTKLTLTDLGMGVRYRLTVGPVSLYSGAGLLVCLFKETNPIGEVEKIGPGGVVRAGLFLRVVRGFLLHAGFGYSTCPMKPADFDIDVGGLEAGAGLAVEF